jgi:hypothetical protein
MSIISYEFKKYMDSQTTIETGSLNITGEETNRLLLLQALFPNITLEKYPTLMIAK